MSKAFLDERDLKQRIRKLKHYELKIRSEYSGCTCNISDYTRKTSLCLVWDEFFDFSSNPNKKVKYPLAKLIQMEKEDYKNVLNEFFFRMYFRVYEDNGKPSTTPLYPSELLVYLGLPYDADGDSVKKRFRELAKQYHPDAGGDSTEFIRLMERRKEIDKIR